MIRPPPRPTPFPYRTLFRSTLDDHTRVSSSQVDTLLADLFTYDTQGRPLTVTTGARTTQLGYHPTSGFLTSITNPLTDVVGDPKSTRLNSSHGYISSAVFCL